MTSDVAPAPAPAPAKAVSYPPADQATTMAEVRTAIDDLDRQIVALLGTPPPRRPRAPPLTPPGKRMRYIEAAARIKPARTAVRDQWRVDDVLSKVRAAAAGANFPPALAADVYAVLVEGSIQHELARWDETRE